MRTRCSLVICVIALLAASMFLLPAGSSIFDASGVGYVPEPVGSRAAYNVTDYEVEYALITNNAMKSEYRPLVEWKMLKGYKAKMYLVEEIYPDYPNGDNAKKVRDFLVDLKLNSPNLKWVVLAGDHEVIPARHMWAGVEEAWGGGANAEWENYYYSDYYYAGLDSNWDKDGDKVYGEVGEEDLTPNVYVGRLPSSNATEAGIMASRIVKYEKDILVGDWITKGIFGAPLMDAPNVQDDPLTNNTDEGYNHYKDNAWEGMQKTINNVPSGITRVEMYDYPQQYSGNYGPSTDTLNSAKFISEFNKGSAITIYLGQAYYGGYALADYGNETGVAQGVMGFRELYHYSNAAAATNGEKTPLVIMATCDSANFTHDENMEALLKSPTGGAIGLISSSGRSYRGEHSNDQSYGNWWISNFMMKNFYGGDTVQGELLYNLKQEYYTKLYDNAPMPEAVVGNTYGYNLLGDPETDIYNGAPRTFKPVVGDIYPGVNTVTITVKDEFGTAIKGARVCLYGKEVHASGVSDKDGEVVLDFTTVNSQNLNLTITGHNFKALLSKASIVPRPKDLQVDESDLMISKDLVVPDEDVSITVTIHNQVQHDFASLGYSLVDSFSVAGIPTSEILLEGAVPVSALGTAEIKYTFNSSFGGDHKIIFKVDPDNEVNESDETNNQVSGTIHVDHAPVFKPIPTIYLDEDTISKDKLQLSEYAVDLDNSIYQLTFELLDNTEADCPVSVSTSGAVSVVPNENWNGFTTATVSVSDGLLEDTAELNITVNATGDKPVLNAVPSQNAFVDEKFTIFIEANDVDMGDTLTFTDDSDLFTIDPVSGEISFIPYSGTAGTYTITIIVTDTNSGPVSTSFKLTITKKPSMAQQEFDVKAGSTFKTTIEIQDPDPGQTYTFSDNTDLFDIDPVTGEIEFDPKDADEGEHTVLITATDGNGTTFTTTLAFTVEAQVESPVPLIILLVIVLIAGLVVVFYFFVRPNLDKITGGEEEDDSEEPEGSSGRQSRQRGRRSNFGEEEDKPRRGRDRPRRSKKEDGGPDEEDKPKRKRGRKTEESEEEPEDEPKPKPKKKGKRNKAEEEDDED